MARCLELQSCAHRNTEQPDRAGSPWGEAAAWSDARPQAVQERSGSPSRASNYSVGFARGSSTSGACASKTDADPPFGMLCSHMIDTPPSELRVAPTDNLHHNRVGQRQAAFGHHLDQIAEAELEAQIPPHARDDNLRSKWRPTNSSSMVCGLPIVAPYPRPTPSIPDSAAPFAPEPIDTTDLTKQTERFRNAQPAFLPVGHCHLLDRNCSGIGEGTWPTRSTTFSNP